MKFTTECIRYMGIKYSSEESYDEALNVTYGDWLECNFYKLSQQY